MSAGGLTVVARPSSTVGSGAESAADAAVGVSSVRVWVADHAAAVAAGVSGVVFTAARADGGAGSGSVGLDVSYAGFRDAFGGDFAARLRLVSLPACVLSTPDVPACQVQTPVQGGRNALDGSTVSADGLVVGSDGSVDAAGSVVTSAAQRREWADSSSVSVVDAPVYALAAGASSPAGDWSASPLSASASWTAGSSGGDFSWSYPLRVPPAISGPSPDLKITYSSGSVDGRTGSANAQPSWVGEGFDLSLPYIERSYLPCGEDGHAGSGDLCWSAANTITLMFGGRSMALVKDATSGVYRPETDDSGLRVDHGLWAGCCLYQGEYWAVTTVDGTRYFFGSNRVEGSSPATTNASLKVPVFGDDPGEECYTGTFATSWCDQGWRWNLDYVQDARGNSMTVYWNKQVNHYKLNGTNLQDYDRAALPDRILYGQRVGAEQTDWAPLQVLFTRAQRCLPNVTCSWSATPSAYPDTPWDQHCEASGACSNTSPTFWSHERLDSVRTVAHNGAAGVNRDVDRWQLGQEYPSPGDGTSAMLYLRSITPSGWDAGSSAWVAGPVTQFDSIGALFPNRVDFDTSQGVPPLNKWRVNLISNSTGGQTWVGYSGQDCTPATIPEGNAHNNTKRCFPQWTTNGTSSGFGWFHKYVTTYVTERDLTGGGPDVPTFYTYSTAGSSTGVLWAHDTSQITNPVRQSWSQWRGYSEVTTKVGATGGQQSTTVARYLRGLHGDKADPSGGIRYVTATDLDGGGTTDFSSLQGRLLDQVGYNGASPVSGTINDYTTTATATQPGYLAGTSWTAYRTYTSQTRARTWLAAGGYRGRNVNFSYNSLNQPTATTDWGDPANGSDDTCCYDHVCGVGVDVGAVGDEDVRQGVHGGDRVGQGNRRADPLLRQRHHRHHGADEGSGDPG